MRDAHRCLDGERRGGRGRAAFLPHERRVLWTEKENHRKKSSCFTQLSRTQKFPGLPFLRSRCFSGLCKSVSSALRKRMEYCWFEERKWRFVRFTSKTLCRLHLIVLVDLIMFTHINNAQISITHLQSHCHMLHSSGIFTFTVPMLDVSFSCIMLCHPRRYRYVKCTQARRPSPCRATRRSGTCSCCRCK